MEGAEIAGGGGGGEHVGVGPAVIGGFIAVDGPHLCPVARDVGPASARARAAGFPPRGPVLPLGCC